MLFAIVILKIGTCLMQRPRRKFALDLKVSIIIIIQTREQA